MSVVYIYHHLGLGDHIICNGLVRDYSEKYEDIFLFSKDRNVENIEFMYRDNSRIKIISVKDDIEANFVCQFNNCIRCGIAVSSAPYSQNLLWDEIFYSHANISFEYAWNKFYYQRDKEQEESIFNKLITNEDYIFVHNKDSSGTDRINWNLIDPSKKIITTQPNIPFFAYAKIIERASEIHCINSSFIHLIDRIPTDGKLFYHKLQNPNPYSDFTQKKQWSIV